MDPPWFENSDQKYWEKKKKTPEIYQKAKFESASSTNYLHVKSINIYIG